MADVCGLECLQGVKGVILDMCGVLYDSGEGGGTAIPGSVEALKRLTDSGLPLRFCTNETQNTRECFVCKLRVMGFNIRVEHVFSPAPAARAIMTERGLRPHLLVHPDLVAEFSGMDCNSPNCVVIGDAADQFSYKNLNQAFQVLIGLEQPVLLSLGQGRYYKETDGLKLDVGVFMKALEYACDVKAEVVGKPSTEFFRTVLRDMHLEPHQVMLKHTHPYLYTQVVMVGDDLVNDVGGAQRCGMKGLQVRTGKYRYVISD
ncbi:hypothetical protein DNTS_004310 [Danionella cerebrum]|uniref:Phospholysine phosphohistidine inorganic pyrophosphate phosphatase n=1 Tax=Danionella cerebrum TaxID=2873325 RepID=A0A553N1U8_9TELE|nr:hypothetical protein DNTS_004310 [Danionella translucida]